MSKTSHVQILDRQRRVKLPKAAVREMCAAILADQGRPGWELSVVFVNDAAIRDYNREYLGRDKPTNVLSLSQIESGGREPSFEHNVLGDVVVSTETCAADAEKAGMAAAEEVVYCLIHGICHLLGFNHEGVGPSRARRMKAAETDLFRRFGPMVLGSRT